MLPAPTGASVQLLALGGDVWSLRRVAGIWLPGTGCRDRRRAAFTVSFALAGLASSTRLSPAWAAPWRRLSMRSSSMQRSAVRSPTPRRMASRPAMKPPRPSSTTPRTTPVGTGGRHTIIANNGTETLSGGGNDVLIGNSSSYVMTGGSGNGVLASSGVRWFGHHDGFQQSDRARPYRDLRQRLWRWTDAGTDATSVFERSADD